MREVVARAMVTVRPAAFPPQEGTRGGTIVELDTTVPAEPELRRFVEYVEAAVGDVDITKSEVVIAVGRGIREEENMPMIEELAIKYERWFAMSVEKRLLFFTGTLILRVHRANSMAAVQPDAEMSAEVKAEAAELFGAEKN